jgi:hypothetical protein
MSGSVKRALPRKVSGEVARLQERFGNRGVKAMLSRRGHGKDGGTTAPAPVGSGAGTVPRRTISLFPVLLPGATRSPDPDIARADAVWRQCSIAVRAQGGQSWDTDVLDRLSPAGTLNEYSDPSSPTAEETAMLSHRPGGNAVIHIYYVPSMSAGSRGEAFWPAAAPALAPAVVVSDSAASDTLAHELGHVLLDDGGHSADPDNLIASGSIRNVGVDNLNSAQCSKV